MPKRALLNDQAAMLQALRSNLTQEQAAAVCGVFINTWRNWEREKNAPPWGTLRDFQHRARELFAHYQAGAAAPGPGRPRKPRNKEPKPKKPKREPFVGPIRKVGGQFKVRPPFIGPPAPPAPAPVPRPLFQRDEFIDALFGRAKEKAPAQDQG